MILRYKKLTPGAYTPHRAHATDAGLDLAPREEAHIEPGRTVRLDTGLAFAIDDGHVGIIAARSSVTLRGLSVVGVVDSQYRGPVALLVTNVSGVWVHVKAGERLAQLIVMPCVTPSLELVTDLGEETERGAGGFGSSNERPSGNGG